MFGKRENQTFANRDEARAELKAVISDYLPEPPVLIEVSKDTVPGVFKVELGGDIDTLRLIAAQLSTDPQKWVAWTSFVVDGPATLHCDCRIRS